ncbi:NADPH-dependent FMN reductase [Zunongwangia endophytica]|uniref:NADPH-dependent FMN reductase n=1 Tax=Zunongwangia endophytica TaxID=1808945 RepID=A0ABV8H952_9FLAO|nr:NAD(P)H-dependent oxidoreductase [Zunongwangia endophytica]MDN3593556.1 NAD(P)H-dependent oxidoreductase [Zunongwangia endophytica]
MKRILGFAGSNSSKSINAQLVANLLNRLSADFKTEQIDIRDYELPFYGEDLENEKGIPNKAQDFAAEIEKNDAVIIAINEHNGSRSAVFKNLIDWVSRHNRGFLTDKKILLVAASPGGSGAATAMAYAKTAFGIFGGDVVETLSFPNFYDNFKEGEITNSEIASEIDSKLNTFAQQI